MTKFSGSQQGQLAQIGAFLRENREQQGKSLQDIAKSTYIRPQLLSGIETGNPDLLPEPIFVQGFIRRYAETLGLKGVEISQQFAIDSIPLASNLTKSSKLEGARSEDSATTRLTRFAPKPDSQQATPEFALQPTASNSSSLAASDEVPVFVASDAESGTDLLDPPIVAAANVEPVPSTSLEPLTSLEVVDEVSAGNSTASNFTEELELSSQLSHERSVEHTSIENRSDDQPILATTDIDSRTPDSKAPIDQVSIEPSSELSTEPTSPLVSDLPLAKAKPVDRQLTTPPISYTSTQPLNSDANSRDTSNLKPFAIGAVVVAVLVAGVVILANALGGDRIPTVADAPTPVESVEPTPPESALPELPEPEPTVEPEPPISDAPLFLEVEVSAPAWTTVVADGNEELFRGTLNPGDRVVWEAQNSINVFSGNPGGLMVSQNGQPAKPLGASGIPSSQDYSVQP